MVDVRINHIGLRDPQRDLHDSVATRLSRGTRRGDGVRGALARRRRDPKKFNFKDAESDHVVRRVVRRDLFHVLPFDAIDFNSIGNRNNNVLHDLGALRDGAADLFGVG